MQINIHPPFSPESPVPALFSACADFLLSAMPDHPCSSAQIRAWIGNHGPVVAYGGTPATGFDIYLHSEANLWCQLTYQFAHELCHVLARYQQHVHSNAWFEEVICEIASMFCLKQIASICFAGAPPHPSLTSFTPSVAPYAFSIEQYANGLIQDPARQLQGTLADWLRTEEESLRASPYQREKTHVASNALFDRFVNEPRVWGAIAYLNSNPCPSGQDSFVEYLQNWRSASPESFHGFISDLMRAFASGNTLAAE